MAGCGRSCVSAHPVSGSFCSPQVKLTVLEKTLGADSLVEGRVSCEPVSETGVLGAGELRPDSKTFMDDTGA